MTETIKLGEEEYEFKMPQLLFKKYLKRNKIKTLELGDFLISELETEPFEFIAIGINAADPDVKMTADRIVDLVGHKVVHWIALVIFIQSYYGLVEPDRAEQLMAAAQSGLTAFLDMKAKMDKEDEEKAPK